MRKTTKINGYLLLFSQLKNEYAGGKAHLYYGKGSSDPPSADEIHSWSAQLIYNARDQKAELSRQ